MTRRCSYLEEADGAGLSLLGGSVVYLLPSPVFPNVDVNPSWVSV